MRLDNAQTRKTIEELEVDATKWALCFFTTLAVLIIRPRLK